MNSKRSFRHRRSAVISTGGMVASSQPLAVLAGTSMLLQGGNAFDAAIATAATLSVVEPMATGIGGDAFALAYCHKSHELKALNASGRAPYAASLKKLRDIGYKEMPEMGIHTVTVPSTLDGWCSLLEKYGTRSLAQVLEPAIYLAENGFPVTEVIAYIWRKHLYKIKSNPVTTKTFLIDGRTPGIGEIFIQPELAKTLKKVAEGGRDAFYHGEIAAAITTYCQENGGLLDMRDLKDHTSTWVEPISINYRGYNVCECPPNGQGLVALLALNILEGFDLKSMEHNSAEYLHLLIETIKLAFADTRKYVADPDFVDIPLKKLLSKAYAEKRRQLIDKDKAIREAKAGNPRISGDTVYLAVTDREGNSVSFINSLFEPFGSAVTVRDTGILLQSRGSAFSLEAGHANCIEPHKRPYHTIIPAMVFKDGELFLTFGMTGALMQPQGQVQVLLNILEFNMGVQTALDAPRFRYLQGSECIFEPGIRDSVLKELSSKGHQVKKVSTPYSEQFGGGQAIMVHPQTKALIAGSDPRKDGCAIGIW